MYDVLVPPMPDQVRQRDKVEVNATSDDVLYDHTMETGNNELSGSQACVDVARSVNSESESVDYFDTEGQSNDRVATAEVLAQEQKDCPTLRECWQLASQNKGNFFVDNGLLYHCDFVGSHHVKQLVLPECRRKVVMEFAHDAPFAGHMAWRRSSYQARIAFFWPILTADIRKWCFTCETCQKHKPVRIADRVPITPIPRDEELPFTHLVMDCIGPIVAE
jgi:hypothetical protein